MSTITCLAYHVAHFKESRATLACLNRTSGRFYMEQLNSVDSGHFIQLDISCKTHTDFDFTQIVS